VGTLGAEGTGGALLARVRALFLLLVAVVLLVSVIEVVDARTPWWPHRTAALAALVGAGVAASWRHRRAPGPGGRRARTAASLDVLAVAALVTAGLGLGRHGAVLALLIGLTQHRALFGTRRSLGAATVGLLAGYLVVGVALNGASQLADLGNLVVLFGIGGIVVVIRLVAETLAWHDVTARWDGVLTDAAAELVAVTEPGGVDDIVDRALAGIRTQGPLAAGGLWAAPLPDGTVPPDATALRAYEATTRTGQLAALDRTLRRLATDAASARERVESETRYRLLAERSRDGIYLLELDPQPAYRYLNPTAEAMAGLDAEALREDPTVALARVHPDDQALVRDARETTGALFDPVQIRLQRDDGTTLWVEVAEAVVEERDGVPTLVQGVVRDISRHRAHEQALHRALAQEQAAAIELRQLDRMKSTFLQAVSHELRTPLTAVLGCAETLRDRAAELRPEDADRLVQTAARQARRLGRLLEDLLDVDRLSRGRVVAERAPVALDAIVGRAIEGIGDDHDRLEVVVEPATVELDGAQVERIVENLLRNALKHTPAGTAIRLHARSHEGSTVLTVEDDGPGVPPELRRSVFEPFSQGPQAGGAASPGTGIGLALVKRLAELHEGDAWVEDADSGGARFVVVLPQPRPADEDPRERASTIIAIDRPGVGDQPASAGAPVTAS
jgi:PAS domain S-box-containing protein